MRSMMYSVLSALTLMLVGCGHKVQDEGVVSQRYVHKYGYAVSKGEFENRKYPGQVITLLKNGVTQTSAYENGVLHGVTTYTFPHSQTVESYYVYNQGNLTKEIKYDISGMPTLEKVQLSPTRYSLTLWYGNGTPLSTEEYVGEELMEGQYYTTNNDVEARVEKGKGVRVRRDANGVLLCRDQIAEGYMTKHEEFYPTGAPKSILYYHKNKLHGEQSTFTASGEPLTTQEYVNGKLHGKETCYKNGAKYLETHYLDGLKNGLEIHYVDGNMISQEILWVDDKQHGPTKYFVDGIAHTEFYYNGDRVSESKWKQLNHVDELIGQISSDVPRW